MKTSYLFYRHWDIAKSTTPNGMQSSNLDLNRWTLKFTAPYVATLKLLGNLPLVEK
jgi:hypothetical protein